MISAPFWLKAFKTLCRAHQASTAIFYSPPSFFSSLPCIVADTMVAANGLMLKNMTAASPTMRSRPEEMNFNKASTSEHEGYASCTELCLNLFSSSQKMACHLN